MHVEGDLIVVEARAVIIVFHFGQVRDGVAGVGGEQGVETAADGLEGDDAVVTGYPGEPNGAAAGLAGMGWFARLLGGAEIGPTPDEAILNIGAARKTVAEREDNQVGEAQRDERAVDRADGVEDGDLIVAAIGGGEIRDGERGVGGVVQIRTVETPLVAKLTPRIVAATVGADGKSVRLKVEPLTKGHVHAISSPGLRNAEGKPLLHATGYSTLNEIPK